MVKEYSIFDKSFQENKFRSDIRELLLSKKSKLEKSLYSRIYFTKSIAAYVSINSDIEPEAYTILAKEFIAGDTVISTMSLAKNCVIGTIFPLEGHETAIGLDLLAHPKRRNMVEKSIETGNTFIAGPVELVEGGIGFISYTPVFSSPGKDSSDFWGVSDIVVYRDKLFSEAGLSVHDNHFKYAMKGEDGSGDRGSIFWGDSTVFDSNPVLIEVLLPTGSWILAAAPKSAWSEALHDNSSFYLLLYLSAFIISVLIWLLSRALSKIRANEKELKALFGSMEDIIIEFSSSGEYVKIAPTNEKLLILPKNELLGKTVFEVFDRETAEFFLNAISSCLETKELTIIDYKLNIAGEEKWFEARLSYLNKDAVIYLAHDNTKRKTAENALIESEQRLKELNAQKDKFFSIIAHDLRSPFQGFIGLTEIISSNIADFTGEEIKHHLNEIHSQAQTILKMLKNLLDWALMKRGITKFEPQPADIAALIEQSVQQLKDSAALKGIKLEYEYPGSIVSDIDSKMMESVLRNLISNAIKFTMKDGAVRISAKLTENGEIRIEVADNGIGMSPEELDKLFKIDVKVGSRGTEGEESTGLGLLLIKEFIDIHKGKIFAESIQGKGTTFIVVIPLINNRV